MSEREELLSRVGISGFRSIASAEVEFGRITVLIGANGAGKSALIGFLEMVSQMMGQNLQTYVARALGSEQLLHYGQAKTRFIKGSCLLNHLERSIEYNFILAPLSRNRLAVADEWVSIWTQGEDATIFSNGPQGLESNIPLTAVVEQDQAVDTIPDVHFLFDCLRYIQVFHFQDTSSASGIRGLQSIHNDTSLHPTGNNIAVMLARLGQEHPKSFERVESELRSVCPEFRKFVLREAWDREREIELRWKGTDPNYIFGPNQFSDGTLRAIALITLTQLPNDWLPSVVVVDEPELGLHPVAVGQIARLLAELSIRRQVIVATQSSIFVSNFEMKDIVAVHQKDGASLFERLEEEELASWLEAFEGDLGRLFEMDVLGSGPQ